MGKRNVFIISSSEDEDDGFSVKSSFSDSKAKMKVRLAPDCRVNPKRPKRSRFSNDSSRSREASGGFDEIKRFCDDFDDGFTGLKVSAGCGKNNKDLWVDKYKPRLLEELAVHKKKVEEVKTWFEERLRIARGECHNNSIVITGQTGVGKSATVHVIASHLGVTVCEWKTPTPTIWGEHLHNSNPGLRYTSKLDEFESFVDRIRKYGLIPSTLNGVYQTPIILLIDDLPLANGKVAHKRLHSCLHRLVQSICIPTAILITDYGKAESTDRTTHFFEELQSSLQNVGAHKVAFNPITDNSIKRTLSKICREEQLKVLPDQICLIAKASGGDIRHAITSLQYFCLNPQPMQSLSFSCGPISNETSDDINHLDDGFALPFGRDETLSLFHALGKFLHNKRENTILSDIEPILLKEKFRRLPLKMDSPEKVLHQAHGQTRTITDFLHENVLDFLSEEAVDDTWAVASYLSDADFLLASVSRMISGNYGAENAIQSASASISVRGVLYGNSHPTPSRWHAIRRPKVWQIDQSLWHNKSKLLHQRCTVHGGVNLCDISVIATEYKPHSNWLEFRESKGYKPHSNWLEFRESKGFESHEALVDSSMVGDENFGIINLYEEDMEISDDEIEDW